MSQNEWCDHLGDVGVHAVGDGVSGVKLDGGECGLGGRGSGSNGSNTVVGKRGVDGGGVGDLRDDGGGGGSDKTVSKSSVSESGVSRSDKTVSRSDETVSGVSSSDQTVSGVSKGKSAKSGVSEGKSGSDDVTLLPLSDGGVGSGVLGLSGGNLSGVDRGDGKGEVEDGSDKGLGYQSGGSDREVGSGNAESVDGVGDVVDSLEETVAVQVLVGSSGHAIGVAGLTTSGWTTSVSKGELTELILSVELMRGSCCWSIDPGVSAKEVLGT